MGNYSHVGKVIEEMLVFFLPLCTEQSTLLELREMVADP
jgi:hypothetical protein